MYNLGTVISFEIIRTLKKKSFWLTSLMFPVIFAAIVGIIYFSNKATDSALEQSQNESFSIALTDESELLSDELVAGFGAARVDDKQAGIASVKNGDVDAYFYYPANVATDAVEVYGKDLGLFDNSRYESTAQLLLNQSVSTTVADEKQVVLTGQTTYSQTTYENGVKSEGFRDLIAPGIFLVLFYFLIATFGSQMLTSTTEEKENRVIEMILVTVKAKTLVIGKILSLILLGLLQSVIVLLPMLALYLTLGDQLSLPIVDLTDLPLDWSRIGVAALIFIVSYLLFTGLLVLIGAAVPTAKEAGNFFGVIMMAIFGPLYAVTLFVSSPEQPLVKFLSFFPLTAPNPLLLRNAVGNLALWETFLALGILLVTTAIVMRLAVRVFRHGALEYSRKLSVKEVVRPTK
jgi:ABC-2 type transport system permease protein